MSLPSGERYATKQIQDICDQARTRVQEMTGRTLEEFKAFLYREQKFADSTRYQIKVYVGGTEYFHLVVFFVSEKGEIETSTMEVDQHHTRDDVIIPVN